MFFKNREIAADLLAERLEEFSGKRPLILAIPRGAISMGQILANRLGGDLDVVLAHKIAAPGNPRLAIGAVSEAGDVILSGKVDFFGMSKKFITRSVEIEMKKLKKLKSRYSRVVSSISPRGRIVLLVDDGIASGKTMQAAIQSLRRFEPAKIVVCSPVASQSAVNLLTTLADQIFVLEIPKVFTGISDSYAEYPQITDDDVTNILAQNRPENMKYGDRAQGER